MAQAIVVGMQGHCSGAGTGLYFTLTLDGNTQRADVSPLCHSLGDSASFNTLQLLGTLATQGPSRKPQLEGIGNCWSPSCCFQSFHSCFLQNA